MQSSHIQLIHRAGEADVQPCEIKSIKLGADPELTELRHYHPSFCQMLFLTETRHLMLVPRDGAIDLDPLQNLRDRFGGICPTDQIHLTRNVLGSSDVI